MKKSIVTLLVLSTITALTLGLSERPPKAVEPGVIKIGAILPLTGDAAMYGQLAKDGMELAKEELNAKGGINGEKVEIIYEDGQCSPEKSVAALHRLVSIYNLPVIIGELCSSATLAMAPIANKNKVILFSPGSSSPDITNAGEFIFRNWPSDTFEGESMAEFAFTVLGIKRISIYFINNEYGLGLKKVFENRFEALGGTILSINSYEQGATDFRTTLLKIKNAKPQAVYLPGHTKELGQILKQAKELELDTQFLSVVGFESPQTIEIAGEAAEGVIYTTPEFDPKSENGIVRRFVQKYTSKYNKEPENFAAHAYDALKILSVAIDKGGYSSEGIKEALYNIKNYPGVSGTTTFDKNGDVEKPATMKILKNGRFIKYGNDT